MEAIARKMTLSGFLKANEHPEKMQRRNSYPCELPAIARKMIRPDATHDRKEKSGMKYDLRKIMLKAWKNFRKYKDLSFGEALHRAWLSAKAEEINQQGVEAAKAAAGITEEAETWSTWKQLGYEVVHGAKALFSCQLIWGSRGDGKTYTASFFGRSQVQQIA